MALEKNQEIELTVEAMSSDGAGVGRAEGMAVFVPRTAVGDRAWVRLIKVTSRYAVGRLERLLDPAPCRVEPDCPVFGRCGGCVYRHITYEEECRLKWRRVADALHRIGALELTPDPLLPADRVDGYRNKALFPVGRGPQGDTLVGFYAPRSHRIVPCAGCRLQPPAFDAALAAFAGWMRDHALPPYDEATGQGLVRHLYLREAPVTGQRMVCVVTAGEDLPFADDLIIRLRQVDGVCSILQNIHPARTNLALGERFVTLWGQPVIEDELCGLRVRLSPGSFYQVNSPQAARLYRAAAELADLRPADVLLDLYCGTGTVGLSMAGRAARLIGVEAVPAAVEDAVENARRNGVENARFLCMDASAAAERLAAEGVRPTVVTLDPPRKGCDAALIDTVAAMAPDRVVYISCDPATLARDLALFGQKGYAARRAIPVDLFPRTSHVETVVLMSRGG